MKKKDKQKPKKKSDSAAEKPGSRHNEILRLISNARSEFGVCSMSKKAHGMEEFSVLSRLLKEVTDTTLAEHLDRIDKVRSSHCAICRLKFLAFCRFFSENRLPDRHLAYVEEYDRTWNAMDEEIRLRGRDFMEEIRQFLLFPPKPKVFATNIRFFRGDTGDDLVTSPGIADYLSANIDGVALIRNKVACDYLGK